MTQQEIQLHSKLHEEWLKHPVTQDAIKVAKKRYEHYKKTLQDGILSSSNPEQENKLRIAMTTCEALSLLLFNTEQFVKQQNKE